MRTPWLRAYSTERNCSTPAPEADISSISSNETTGSLRASGTIRGSALNTPATSVEISHTSAPSAAASATAVVSEPPRPSVVTSRAVLTPWKPATSTIRSSSSAWWMRSARTSRMRALVCDVSVTMPACEPVRLMARWPRSLIAIAHNAHEIRSPVDSSMSISRGSGAVDTSSAIEISSSVVLPRAESTATTRWPCSRADTIRRAARLMRSASATDVPPNFITTVPDTYVSLGVRGSAPRKRCFAAADDLAPPGLERAAAGEGAAQRDLVGVLQVAAHRESGGQARDRDVGGALVELARDVQGGRLAGGGRVGGQDDLAHAVLDPAVELGEAQVLGLDAVDRRKRAAEHVV